MTMKIQEIKFEGSNNPLAKQSFQEQIAIAKEILEKVDEQDTLVLIRCTKKDLSKEHNNPNLKDGHTLGVCLVRANQSHLLFRALSEVMDNIKETAQLNMLAEMMGIDLNDVAEKMMNSKEEE